MTFEIEVDPNVLMLAQGWKGEKNLKFLLQKVLKQSDVGSLGRIVLPKVRQHPRHGLIRSLFFRASMISGFSTRRLSPKPFNGV